VPTVFPPGNGGVGGTAKLPRSATIAGGIALAAFLYVAWIEWRPLLAMPPRAVVEGAEPLSMPDSRVGAGDADRATSPVPSAPLPPREPSVRESPAAAVAEGLPGSATTGPGTGSSPAAETGGPERPPAALDEARARPGAPADVPSPASEPDESREKPRRPLSLGGWVLDRDGNAAAAVPVQALPRRLFAALDDGTGNVPMPEPRFVTDGGGRFAFEQLPDGEYELRTDRTELYEKAMAVVRAGLDSAVIVVEKRSGRTLFVHGAVESSRGGPLKGVRVEVVGQPRLASISDESGQYGLRVPLGGQLPEPSIGSSGTGTASSDWRSAPPKPRVRTT